MRNDAREMLPMLEQFSRLPSEHASHFNWSDKQTKEAGVVDEFLKPENHGVMLQCQFQF